MVGHASVFLSRATWLGCFCLPAVLGKIHFEETFSDGEGWKTRWHQSHWRTRKASNGNFTIQPIELLSDAPGESHFKEGSHALTVQGDHKFFAVVAPFEPFSNRGKILTVQFTINVKNDPICSHVGIKLGPTLPNWDKFSRRSPYHIKFGPYYCGQGNHITELEFAYKNRTVPKTEDIPYFSHDRFPARYRLTLYPDNAVKVSYMGKEKFKGNLEHDWKLLEPVTIDDPTDTKPSHWHDAMYIQDVHDKKPANWVDHKRIPDHTIKKPTRWDESEDGPWMPTQPNPDYKGEWKPRMIRNHRYIGEWKKRQIANPEYSHDAHDAELYRYDDIAYIALEFWNTRGGVQFDDFLICDTEAEADERVKQWEAWEAQLKADYLNMRKNMPSVQQAWDDKSEVEDYDEEDEAVPILPRSATRHEL